jgi:polysaccharide export outer membrane protein
MFNWVRGMAKVIALAVASAVTACAGAQGVAPAQAAAAAQTGAPTQADVAQRAAAVPTDYLIGPGDQLQIFVWDHPDLTTNVQVRPDGKISTPLVEDLQAAGKTPTQLGREVERTLAEYVRSPVVTVIVQGFVGDTGQQIRVVGQAVQPKAVHYRQGMTVLDVMIEVGGLSQFAAGNRARIVRVVNGKETEIRVKLESLLNDGRIKENVKMLPGDVLVIPQSVL